MSVTQILRISIPVSDQERSKGFFRDAVGLDVLGDNPVPMGENARWIELAPKGARTSLVLTNWLGMLPGALQGIMLETQDIDDQITRLKRAGITVDGPHATPWGTQASFSDPDGNGFVLTTPIPQG